jgi:hypothetical protein
MISRHIDVIAIGLLLLGLAFCEQFRRAAAFQINTIHRVGISSHRDGAIVLVPPVSPRPPFPFARD